jgi:hypothetical protein
MVISTYPRTVAMEKTTKAFGILEGSFKRKILLIIFFEGELGVAKEGKVWAFQEEGLAVEVFLGPTLSQEYNHHHWNDKILFLLGLVENFLLVVDLLQVLFPYKRDYEYFSFLSRKTLIFSMKFSLLGRDGIYQK